MMSRKRVMLPNIKAEGYPIRNQFDTQAAAHQFVYDRFAPKMAENKAHFGVKLFLLFFTKSLDTWREIRNNSRVGNSPTTRGGFPRNEM